MQEKGIKLDGTVNLGTLIHLFVLVTAIALAWGTFDRRTTILEIQSHEQGKTMQEIKAQTNRIERYLMTSDPAYWKKVKDNGDSTQ